MLFHIFFVLTKAQKNFSINTALFCLLRSFCPHKAMFFIHIEEIWCRNNISVNFYKVFSCRFFTANTSWPTYSFKIECATFSYSIFLLFRCCSGMPQILRGAEFPAETDSKYDRPGSRVPAGRTGALYSGNNIMILLLFFILKRAIKIGYDW